MNEKEAIRTLGYQLNMENTDVYTPINYEAIEIVLNLLEKKEKIIDEMAEWLYGDDTSFGYGNLKDVNTPEKIKQYFEKKVEEDK